MMKYYTLLFAISIFSLSYSQSSDDFVITYQVDNTIGLDVYYPFYGGDFTIDLGDGNTLTDEDVNTSSIDHTYSSPGTYTIIVSGDINEFNFSIVTNIPITIEQWGTAQWVTMEEAFSGVSDLTINATDTPDLSQVTSMKRMFRNCDSFNSPINNWDVSNVTDMYGVFENAVSFNQPLNNWDVSNVTIMKSMFSRATSFNQNINNWDVSNVTDMVGMFGCFPDDNSTFNQPLNNWDVSNVTDMYWMFRYAYAFNQPLDNWDVSNVQEFGFMFLGATSFNQNINSWNMSNAISIRGMFNDSTSFNQPLDNWDTSSVNSMGDVFHNATSFNQDISNWTFDNVTDFSAGPSYESFIGYTSMDTDNYDSLLLALVQSSLQNEVLLADDVEYCDSQVRSYLDNVLGWNISDGGLSDDCENYTISGNVYLDIDNDGCDLNDMTINGALISAVNSNSNFEYGSVSENGDYLIEANQGTFSINVLNLPDYFNVSPINASAVLDDNTASETIDFCLVANQDVEDLNVTILPLDEARPGFQSKYKVIVENIGTEIVNNVNVSFTFDDSVQSFISAVPAPSNSTSNTIDFDIGSIETLQQQEIEIVTQLFTPPTVNADDVLNFNANVTPNTNDSTPVDNTYNLEHIVVNAFDPNDKTVLQGENIIEDQTSKYLDYIIRFQNTGNADATFVRIEDIIDDNLDWSTLKMVDSSHDYTVKIENGNSVEFFFDNINLPYEAADDDNSKGYIAYKIKPKTSIQIGDVISGNASIYFDYNPPILTNTVSTEVIDNLSIDEYSVDNGLTIYPNPTNEYFEIKKSNNLSIETIRLYNISGKLLREFQESERYITSDLNSGFYFLIIKTGKSEIIKKLVKS